MMKLDSTYTLLLLISLLPQTTALFGIKLPFQSSKKENPFQQWELSTQPQDFDLTINTLNSNILSPNLVLEHNIFNEDEYSLCVNKAIEPVYLICMNTSPGKPTSLKSVQKSKMSIDLLICELKSIYLNSFHNDNDNDDASALSHYNNKGNEMNVLIYNILALEKIHENDKDPSMKFYNEVLEMIKQNNNLWTTYTLKNEKLEKLCTEFAQPLQKYHLENVMKQYSAFLQEEIALNNKNAINAIKDLKSYLHEKMEEVANDLKQDVKNEIKGNIMHVKEKLEYLKHKQQQLMNNFDAQFRNFTLTNGEALKNVTTSINHGLQKQKKEIDTFVSESFILKKEYFYLSKIFTKCYRLFLFMFRYKFILAVVVVIYWRYKTIISLVMLFSIATYLIAIDLINYLNLENVSQHIFNEILPHLFKKVPKIIMAVIVMKKIPQFWVFKKKVSIVVMYFVDVFLICLDTYDQQISTPYVETNGEFLILATIALNLYFKSWMSIKRKLAITSLIMLFVLSTMFITEYRLI